MKVIYLGACRAYHPNYDGCDYWFMNKDVVYLYDID